MKRFLPALLLPVMWLGGCASQTVTPADKTGFVTLADLRTFGYANPKLPVGKWSKTAYGDGTFEIEYEAETPDSEQNFPLYFTETLSDEKNSGDARTLLATERGAITLALKSQKLSEKSVAGETIYGDGSSLTVLQSGKISVGNVFSARKGGRTFFLMMSGVAFDDPKEWDDFAGKKINAWLDGAT